MSNNKKTRGQLEAELAMLRSQKRGEGWVSIVLSFIRWGAIVWITRYAYLGIASLSGKQTMANISLLSDISISTALAWSGAIGGTAYGLSQRSLRRKELARLEGKSVRKNIRVDDRKLNSSLNTKTKTTEEGEH